MIYKYLSNLYYYDNKLVKNIKQKQKHETFKSINITLIEKKNYVLMNNKTFPTVKYGILFDRKPDNLKKIKTFCETLGFTL
jgi:hypothetical protein